MYFSNISCATLLFAAASTITFSTASLTPASASGSGVGRYNLAGLVSIASVAKGVVAVALPAAEPAAAPLPAPYPLPEDWETAQAAKDKRSITLFERAMLFERAKGANAAAKCVRI